MPLGPARSTGGKGLQIVLVFCLMVSGLRAQTSKGLQAAAPSVMPNRFIVEYKEPPGDADLGAASVQAAAMTAAAIMADAASARIHITDGIPLSGSIFNGMSLTVASGTDAQKLVQLLQKHTRVAAVYPVVSCWRCPPGHCCFCTSHCNTPLQ